jgi:hypothetical protein
MQLIVRSNFNYLNTDSTEIYVDRVDRVDNNYFLKNYSIRVIIIRYTGVHLFISIKIK